MEGLSGINEVTEVEQSGNEGTVSFDQRTLDKYDKILGDNIIEEKNGWNESVNRPLSPDERKQKYSALFDLGGMFKGVDKMIAIPSESYVDEKSVNEDVEESSDDMEKDLEDEEIDEKDELDSEVDDVPQFEKGKDGKYYDKETGKPYEDWKKEQETKIKRAESTADYYKKKADKEWAKYKNAIDPEEKKQYYLKSQQYYERAEKCRGSAEKRKQQVEKVKIELFGEKGANLEYELDGDKYETDDNGVTYKKNGELLPDVEYSENGHVYQTDSKGRIKSCDGKPQYNDDGSRNIKEQKESGGEERQADDDGGHVIAKILNGPEGSENLVPMRRTINRGDYKKMENEIAKAIQEGKKVTMHVDIEYDGDSQRPSKIRVEYTIDGKKIIVEFDNKENSTELLDSLEGMISDEDYQDLKDEIEDMKNDGADASVTSVKTEYDENGNPTRITVGILDESTGKKFYKVYEPRKEA